MSDSDEEGPSYDTESDISDEQSDLLDSGLSTINEYVEIENWASAEDDTPVLLVLTPSMQFAMYEGHIPHSSIRLAIIKIEAEQRGDRWALGSAVARKLEYLLELTQPYPGDLLNILQFRGPRFKAHQKSATEIVVSDQIYDMNNTLSVDVAINQEFEVANWYAQLHHERSRVTTELSSSTQVTLHAPDVWLWNASLVLQGGALYPGDAELSRSILNPRRFKIELTDEWATMYAIRDSHLDFHMIIAGEHLQNEKFNIQRWYSKMLIQAYQCLEGEVF